MADWHLSGMFHMPPLLSVFEMTGDMPCSLDLWDASNASEFEGRVQWPLRPDFAHSVRDCTRILLEDQASDTKVARLVCLSMSDMQLVIMGIQNPFPFSMRCVLKLSRTYLLHNLCKFNVNDSNIGSSIIESALYLAGFVGAYN